MIGEEDLIEINFEAVAAYHGQGALAMLAVTFRALEVALKALSPDQPPKRSAITIVSGHPGPGKGIIRVRDTGRHARCLYGGSLLAGCEAAPSADLSYSFRVTLDGRTAEIAVLPNALPERFFVLTFNPSRSAADEIEVRRLRKSIASDVLAASADKLFQLRVV